MHNAHRHVHLGATQMLVERDSQGRYTLRAAQPLAPYPTRLTERLAHWARVAPERVFLAKRGDNEQGRGRGLWRHLTYGEAYARIAPLASALLERGLHAERPLMILSENDLENALLVLAAQHVGVPYVPISPAYSLVSRDHERLRDAVRTLTPGLVFAADGARFARAIAAAVPSSTEVLVTQGGSELGRPYTLLSDLESERPTPEVEHAHASVGPDTIAKFLLTSGSTGTPKAVIQTMRMLTSNLQMIAQCLPFLTEEPPLIVDWLPWHHTFGGNHNVGITLYNGGSLYIDEGRPTSSDFRESLRNLSELSPNVYFNVPRGYDQLARELERDEALAKRFFSRVKLLFYAAASLSQRTWDTLEQVAERACGERVVMITGLGMTETSPYALSAHWPGGRPGEVGIPAPGVEARLVPVGAKLEVRYRGPSVTPGYWRDPALTERSFDEDGFYRSGDAVEFVDPEEPQRGLLFAGRLGEDFKLDSGTWVSVGPLRARVLLEGAPYVQDIVAAAPDRSELGILIVPHIDSCRELCPELAPSAPLAEVLQHPRIRECFQGLLDRLAASSTGSANRIVRALLLSEPLSLDRGEITDKGTVVQAVVRSNYAALVDKLYSADPDVILARAR